MRPGLLQLFAISLLIVAPATVDAQQPASRADTEEALRDIKAEIAALQKSLTSDRQAFRQEQEAIRALDLDIQANATQLRELAGRTGAQQAELDALLREREAFLEQLANRHRQLKAQILAAWRMSRESRIKLVLNQDSPARASRLLAYYDFINRAQADKIGELREVLAGLDVLRDSIAEELRKLDAIRQKYEQAKGELQGRRNERLDMLQGLEEEIGGGEARLVELERNRQDLETLLKNLADALADIPADLGQYQHPGHRKGQLPMPIKARVLRAFGQPRGASLAWQGWLLEASAGAEIRAIAYGRVAYADWLRGYGLLIIIDHGEGFMSLYGNNESLLFEVGDWVQPGSVIATVGSNPGQSQGLYFELRNGGKAVDPAVWISRR